MKSAMKKIFTLLSCMLLFLCLMPAECADAAQTVASGKCGTNATWTYYSDGVLRINGSGSMADYQLSGGNDPRPYGQYLTLATKIVVNNGITRIGDSAFSGFIQAASVQIADSVTTIGTGAFLGSGIQTLTIPASVKSISSEAFELCTSLREVEINITANCQIESLAFGGCSNLKKVLFGSGYVMLSDRVFAGCSALEELWITGGAHFPTNSYTNTQTGEIADPVFLTVPANLVIYDSYSNSGTNVQSYAKKWGIPYSWSGFCGAEGSNLKFTMTSKNNEMILTISGNGRMKDYPFQGTDMQMEGIPWLATPTRLIVESGVTSIGDHAFLSCPLTSVTLPSSLTSIGKYAFLNCNELKSITIPSNVTMIEKGAFESSGLTDITIPSGVTTIATFTFSDCKCLKNVNISTGVEIIDDYAFTRCDALTSVTIPSTVTSIGTEAFYICSQLSSITIPSSVTSIGENAFYNCTGLTRVNVNDIASWCKTYFGNQYANPLVFAGDLYLNGSRVTNLVIPSGVSAIGNGAFLGCKSISSIYFPTSLTGIGHSAFSGCSGLTRVIIPSSVKSIGPGAFASCTGLTDITIPSGITSIEAGTFSGCNSLTEISIPTTVKTIGASAFSGCSGLPHVSIPSNVTSIGEGAFSACSGLTDITIPSGVPSIEAGTFYNCGGLKTVSIPSSVTSIGTDAFSGCSSLTDVVYGGTQTQWNAVTKGENNDSLNSAAIYYGGTMIYAVSYDANGGTGAPSAQTEKKGESLTISADKPTRENTAAESYTVTLNANGVHVSPTSLTAERTTNYTFETWNTKADGTGTSYSSGASYTANISVTLYAQWTDVTTTSSVTLPTPSRSGYNFKGWGTTSAATTGATGNYTPTGNITLYAVWEKIPQYTVSFNANGGTGAPVSQTKTQGVNLTLSSVKPTRSGVSDGSYAVTLNANGGSVSPTSLTANRTTTYSFNNWNTKTDGTGMSYASGATYSVDSNLTLYAQWTGSTTTSSVTLPTPSRNGYTFKGWGTDSTETAGMTGNFTPTGNVTLYAVWDAQKYTITYDANGGTGGPENQNKTHGVALNLSEEIPERNGFFFLGWAAKADTSDADYQPGDRFDLDEETTLYAVWAAPDFTMPDSLRTIGEEAFESGIFVFAKLSDQVTEIQKRAFADCRNLKFIYIPKTAKIIDDNAFENDSNLTIFGEEGSYAETYAKGHDYRFLEVTTRSTTFTISFDANGGANSPDNQIKWFGSPIKLSTERPERATEIKENYIVSLDANGGSVDFGFLTASKTNTYVFRNWNTARDGSGESYEPGGNYLADASVHLYAQWNTTSATEELTLPTPVRNGYIFKGWSENLHAISGISGKYTPSGNETLYAIWEIMKYTVSYDANGGINAPQSQTKVYGTNLLLSQERPVRTPENLAGFTVALDANGGKLDLDSLTAERVREYEFANWNTKKDGSGTSYSAGDSYLENADVILFGQWTDRLVVESVMLPEPTREGYTFLGWTENPNSANGIMGSYIPSDSVTLYALWTITTYSVSYDANGGINAPENQSKLHDEEIVLSSIQPTHQDNMAKHYTVTLNANGGEPQEPLEAVITETFRFINWNTESDGSGVTYNSGSSYTENKALTLYAQWESKVSTEELTLPTPIRTGYIFKGWAEDSHALSGISGKYVPNDSVTMYAIWEIMKYTVSYDANGGISAPQNQIKEYGTSLTLSPEKPQHISESLSDVTVTLDANGGNVEQTTLAAERTRNYIFTNWNTQSDASGTSYAAGDLYFANADVTLYGQWEEQVEVTPVKLPAPERNGYIFLGWATSTDTVNVEYRTDESYIFDSDITLYSIWEKVLVAKGSCGAAGDNVTWSLDSEGMLEITGTGKMADNSSVVPWREYATQITTAVIQNGVTNIGDFAFSECSSLTSITIPNSVTIIGQGAFRNCSALTSVTIPDSVTLIAYEAFLGCKGLTSITIPNSVTTIGQGAFKGCNSANSLSISNGLTSIRKETFSRCSGLTSIIIPETISSIGEEAFSYCSGLSSVIISDSVTEIGDGVFYYCNKLANVTIPANLSVISPRSFAECRGLTNITIPEKVKSIGEYAFSQCYSLSVLIPDKVTDIGVGAFNGCKEIIYCGSQAQWEMIDGYSNVTGTVRFLAGTCGKNGDNLSWMIDKDGVLRITGSGLMASYTVSTHAPWYSMKTMISSLSISEGVTSIGNYAFYECSSMTSTVIPSSVSSIGGMAFYGCKALTSVNITDIERWCGTSFSDNYSNPLTYAHNLYLNNKPISELVIPSSVSIIHAYTFSGCSSLMGITIPANVREIGESAFSDCSGLKDVIIPEGVYKIAVRAFSGCTGMTSVTIPSTLSSSGSLAFSGCRSLMGVYISNLTKWCGISFANGDSNPLGYAHNLYLNGSLVTEIEIPSNLTTIKNYAFYGCYSLTKVTIPNTVTSISECAFSQCLGLRSITIPSRVTSIGYGAFEHCRNMTSVTLAEGLESIGKYAFNECSSLTSLTIPSSVTSIGDYAFLKCTALTSLELLPRKALFATACFSSCTGLNDVTILSNIGSYMFSNCTNLTSITIGDGVTRIYDNAFTNCNNLTTIILPSSLTSIGANAIPDSVTDISFSGTESEWNSISIGSGNTALQNATVHYN